jgi:hypothetical protein
MKPTRNIVKPNKGYWNAKHKVWFEKNDDGDLTKEEIATLDAVKKNWRSITVKLEGGKK